MTLTTVAHYGKVAQATATAYKLASEGQTHARFRCPACGGTIEFTARAGEPHRPAGSCKTPGCVRWAT